MNRLKYDGNHKAANLIASLIKVAITKDELIEKFPDRNIDIAELYNSDQTGQKIIFNFFAKELIANPALNLTEAITIAHDMQTDDIKNKLRRANKPTDINAYRGKLGELKETLKNIKDLNLESGKQNKKKQHVASGGEKIFSDENIEIVYVDDKATLAQHAHDTSWCVTSWKSTYFEQYAIKNTLFYIIFLKDQESPNKKFLYSYSRTDRRTEFANQDQSINTNGLHSISQIATSEEADKIVAAIKNDIASNRPYTKYYSISQKMQDPAQLDVLAGSKSVGDKLAVLENKNTGKATVIKLLRDSNENVRMAAFRDNRITEEDMLPVLLAEKSKDVLSNFINYGPILSSSTYSELFVLNKDEALREEILAVLDMQQRTIPDKIVDAIIESQSVKLFKQSLYLCRDEEEKVRKLVNAGIKLNDISLTNKILTAFEELIDKSFVYKAAGDEASMAAIARKSTDPEAQRKVLENIHNISGEVAAEVLLAFSENKYLDYSVFEKIATAPLDNPELFEYSKVGSEIKFLKNLAKLNNIPAAGIKLLLNPRNMENSGFWYYVIPEIVKMPTASADILRTIYENAPKTRSGHVYFSLVRHENAPPDIIENIFKSNKETYADALKHPSCPKENIIKVLNNISEVDYENARFIETILQNPALPESILIDKLSIFLEFAKRFHKLKLITENPNCTERVLRAMLSFIDYKKVLRQAEVIDKLPSRGSTLHWEGSRDMAVIESVVNSPSVSAEIIKEIYSFIKEIEVEAVNKDKSYGSIIRAIAANTQTPEFILNELYEDMASYKVEYCLAGNSKLDDDKLRHLSRVYQFSLAMETLIQKQQDKKVEARMVRIFDLLFKSN